MLGSLTAAAPRLVPDLPRKVAVPLAVGAWVNANAFGVLAFRPELKEHPVYKAGVVGSFMPRCRTGCWNGRSTARRAPRKSGALL
jgi:hypothetical protein